MRFSTINALVIIGATLTVAAPMQNDNSLEARADAEVYAYEGITMADATPSDEALEKRAAGAAILTAVGTEVAVKAVDAAITATSGLIKSLSNWTSARETFTKQAVLSMINKNPNKAVYAAAICYNKGYHFKDAAGIDGKTSIKLTSGALHTDYDCFYMKKGNSFYSEGDGGYINLAIQSTGCSYDSKTSDLTC